VQVRAELAVVYRVNGKVRRLYLLGKESESAGEADSRPVAQKLAVVRQAGGKGP
jgi:hypothetical protein